MAATALPPVAIISSNIKYFLVGSTKFFYIQKVSPYLYSKSNVTVTISYPGSLFGFLINKIPEFDY